MSFISENFEIVGDSYIDSKGCAHRLKNVRAVAYGMDGIFKCLVVLTPYGNDCVIPLSLLVHGEQNHPDSLLRTLLASAREEFLKLVHLASDSRLPLQEGENFRSFSSPTRESAKSL